MNFLNILVENMLENQIFYRYGVNNHGMFILGEDYDTIKELSKTVDFAIVNKIDTIQLMGLTPFPETTWNTEN